MNLKRPSAAPRSPWHSDLSLTPEFQDRILDPVGSKLCFFFFILIFLILLCSPVFVLSFLVSYLSVNTGRKSEDFVGFLDSSRITRLLLNIGVLRNLKQNVLRLSRHTPKTPASYVYILCRSRSCALELALWCIL